MHYKGDTLSSFVKLESCQAWSFQVLNAICIDIYWKCNKFVWHQYLHIFNVGLTQPRDIYFSFSIPESRNKDISVIDAAPVQPLAVNSLNFS